MEAIPFMDLGAQIRALEPEIRQTLDQIVRDCSFIGGPRLQSFNESFLRVHGGSYGVGCSNGTSAITVALRALGVGPGDEVLVPNHTFFGTLEPIAEVGAKPVLVDIDPEYHQLDLNFAEKKITPKTKAIVPVHLYGVPEPMDQVMAFAKKHNLKVIEDCAQAHLAKWQGQAVGTFGDIGTFSFYPGKNLGAFGDAGFILTENQQHFEFIKRYIDHGRTDKYVHDMFGGNFRIDTLQAAILEIKLKKMNEWTDRRRELAHSFDERLKDFQVLKVRKGATPVYHLYVVEVSNRDEVMKHFKTQNIGCGIHYPMPMSLQPALTKLGVKAGDCPVSEAWSKRILSLPFFPEMTMPQVERVTSEFLKVAKK